MSETVRRRVSELHSIVLDGTVLPLLCLDYLVYNHMFYLKSITSDNEYVYCTDRSGNEYKVPYVLFTDKIRPSWQANLD